MLGRRSLLAGAVVALASIVQSAQADAVSDFYRGRTITIVNGQPAGGTYDLYSRVIARRLGAHIPGNPNVIVQNMPGAGTLTATLHVAVTGAQDGTLIAATASALPYLPLLDPNESKFDPLKVNWLPTPAAYGVTMVVGRNSPVRSFDDLRRHETVMSTLSPGQLPAMLVAVTNATLGTKIKGVTGYPNLNDSMLAMDRGEIDGYPSIPFDALKRTYAKPLAQGDFRVIAQYGPSASADYPQAPYVPDLATNDEARTLLDLAMAPLKSGYPYLTGARVPAERVRALREGLMATFADPLFLEDCARATLTIAPVDGEHSQAIVAEAYRAPPAMIARFRAITQPTGK